MNSIFGKAISISQLGCHQAYFCAFYSGVYSIDTREQLNERPNMVSRTCLLIAVGIMSVLSVAGRADDHAVENEINVPFINTWLVLGTFDNDPCNHFQQLNINQTTGIEISRATHLEPGSGYTKDIIGEPNVVPKLGMITAERKWVYFDDRLFSRNYDCYNDLYSYFKIKLKESAAAKVVYAHIYLHSPQAQSATLGLGADNEHKAWLNGELVSASAESLPLRDEKKVVVTLKTGWNRLLLKICNQEEGRLGFYASIADCNGKEIPGLTISVNGPTEKLAVTTQPMCGIGVGTLPVVYREWPYFGTDSTRYFTKDNPVADEKAQRKAWEMIGWRDAYPMKAPPFRLVAEGGIPPYIWRLVEGELPKGLTLQKDGTLGGTTTVDARLDKYAFKVEVKDANGAIANKELAVDLKERPNRWVEESRLVGLIGAPELVSLELLPEMANLMKRQGYGLGMPIAYGNAWMDNKPRWPSMIVKDANNPKTECMANYRYAFEKAGIKFGLYMGEVTYGQNGGMNGTVSLFEEMLRLCHPKAIYLDQAGRIDESGDAYYSVIRTFDPEIVLIKNGVPTAAAHDWDILCAEGLGAVGKSSWEIWPVPLAWPKKNRLESWRHLSEPGLSFAGGVPSDWRTSLAVQLSLIGDGFIADMDHTATFGTAPDMLVEGQLRDPNKSPMWQQHEKMAEWANPPGMPSLTESYTQVDQGPLACQSWGYNLINFKRDVIYLHLMANGIDKTGVDVNTLAKSPFKLTDFKQTIKSITLMNKNTPLSFKQQGQTVDVNLAPALLDSIDTILKISLKKPYPIVEPVNTSKKIDEERSKGGKNLAYKKSAVLLSVDGSHQLAASVINYAFYGVDGLTSTTACGAWEWGWTYQVDIGEPHQIGKIVVVFGVGFPTEFRIDSSVDQKTWQTLKQENNGNGEKVEITFAGIPIRYIRVVATKPDGPNQKGGQMSIGELEAYAAE